MSRLTFNFLRSNPQRCSLGSHPAAAAPELVDPRIDCAGSVPFWDPISLRGDKNVAFAQFLKLMKLSGARYWKVRGQLSAHLMFENMPFRPILGRRDITKMGID